MHSVAWSDTAIVLGRVPENTSVRPLLVRLLNIHSHHQCLWGMNAGSCAQYGYQSGW
jgi:hypothetical protein